MKKSKIGIFLSIFCLLSSIFYAIYSYSQIDLNLTLSSNNIYQSFQKSMIQLGYFNRPLSSLIYSLIIIFLFTNYYLLITFFKKRMISVKNLLLLTGLLVGVLVFSYPALSHDIFNYIFNAKMVLVYHKNPHVNVALEFPNDLWTRFMHNTHTPAPYFYGWTIISLIPSLLGFGKLTLNLLTFKLFEIPLFFWQIYLLNKILTKLLPKERRNRLFLFILNPLVLIEVFGNGHNDLVMTNLALFSFWFLIKEEKVTFKNLFLSLVFLLLSASIKYVTIILLPLYLIYFFILRAKPRTIWCRAKREVLASARTVSLTSLDVGGIAATILFLAIFTRPQNQFQSWYLIWSLSFAVFSKNKWILSILLFFSFSLMLRYAPLLYYGEYNKQVMEARIIITYSIPAILVIFSAFKAAHLGGGEATTSTPPR